MLTKEFWADVCPRVRPGHRLRVNHDCGPGRTLLVSEEGGKYRAWCFRCNSGGQTTGPEPSIEERLARVHAATAADAGRRATLVLPDMVQDPSEWPPLAKLWLYRAGLGAHDCGRLGAGYDPASGRVFVPVRENGVLVFWQARSIDGRQPKYLAPDVDKRGVLPRYGHGHGITLTEDILSAYKVGQVGEAWSLLGTRASSRVLTELMARRERVRVWLDPDRAGQKAATKLVHLLHGIGVAANNVVSEKDPKLLTYSSIKGMIE